MSEAELNPMGRVFWITVGVMIALVLGLLWRLFVSGPIDAWQQRRKDMRKEDEAWMEKMFAFVKMLDAEMVKILNTVVTKGKADTKELLARDQKRDLYDTHIETLQHVFGKLGIPGGPHAMTGLLRKDGKEFSGTYNIYVYDFSSPDGKKAEAGYKEVRRKLKLMRKHKLYKDRF